MTRKEFENAYLDKYVEITINNGRTHKGILRKTGTEYVRYEPNLYLIQNYYFIESEDGISTLYRKSHIKKIRLSKESIIM